jgi:hypothetical protein
MKNQLSSWLAAGAMLFTLILASLPAQAQTEPAKEAPQDVRDRPETQRGKMKNRGKRLENLPLKRRTEPPARKNAAVTSLNLSQITPKNRLKRSPKTSKRSPKTNPMTSGKSQRRK